MSRPLTFGGSAGEGSVECLNMTLINDEVAEVDEDSTVIVEPVSDFVTTASPSSATFTIVRLTQCHSCNVCSCSLKQSQLLDYNMIATQWLEQNLQEFVYSCLPNHHLRLSPSML